MAFSATLAVFIAISLALNLWFVTRDKVVNAFILFFAVLLFIPPEAIGLISGSPYGTSGILNMSMAAYDAVILFACLVVTRKLKIQKISVTGLVVMSCCLVIILMRICADGSGALSNKMIDNYFVPMLAAVSMSRVLNPDDMPKLLKFIYAFILINAAVACLELVIKQSLLFDAYYLKTVKWYRGAHNIYRADLQFRGTAFLGHPLVNGVYYVLGIVYLYNKPVPGMMKNVRLTVLKALQFALLTGAILSTNSRGALLVFAVYTVIYLYTNKKIGKLLLLLICVAVLIVALDFEKIYNSLFARDTSGNSLMGRLNGLAVFGELPLESVLLGEGLNKIASLLTSYDMTSNFEISYLIIILEIGFIGFVIWVIAMIAMYSPKMAVTVGDIKAKSMVNGMILCFLLISATGNLIGDPGTLNYMLWALLAFSRVLSKGNNGGVPQRTLINRANTIG